MSGSLEAFVKEYLHSIGGLVQEVEPQVMDLMADIPGVLDEGGLERFCFDPEALADHPESQLMTIGNPVLDALFADARKRGMAARVFIHETHLSPFQVEKEILKEFQVEKGIDIHWGKGRVVYFSSILFWFQATLTSDEKLQYLYPIGVDLYHGRIVKHLEELIRGCQISSQRPLPYPDAHGISVIEAYELARSDCQYKISRDAKYHRDDLKALFEKESSRVAAYFYDLIHEIDEQIYRHKSGSEKMEALAKKKKSLMIEKDARMIDLKKKLDLQVQTMLMNWLHICQPKIMIPLTVKTNKGASETFEIIWDPRNSRTESVSCPVCGSLTLCLGSKNGRQIGCKECCE